jgi:hypothetical protein
VIGPMWPRTWAAMSPCGYERSDWVSLDTPGNWAACSAM